MVKSVSYKLSTSSYWKLGETNVFIKIFSNHSLTPSPSHFPSPSFPPIQRVRADVDVRPRRPADAGLRPRLYNLHPHSIFCSFSPLTLVGVVGFAWQHPFRLAKGEGVTSILRGIPLRFLQSKNSRVAFTLLMLVFSVMHVFM
jgi:hypothetical protein